MLIFLPVCKPTLLQVTCFLTVLCKYIVYISLIGEGAFHQRSLMPFTLLFLFLILVLQKIYHSAKVFVNS